MMRNFKTISTSYGKITLRLCKPELALQLFTTSSCSHLSKLHTCKLQWELKQRSPMNSIHHYCHQYCRVESPTAVKRIFFVQNTELKVGLQPFINLKISCYLSIMAKVSDIPIAYCNTREIKKTHLQ